MSELFVWNELYYLIWKRATVLIEYSQGVWLSRHLEYNREDWKWFLEMCVGRQKACPEFP
jgi:hypothetical protein